MAVVRSVKKLAPLEYSPTYAVSFTALNSGCIHYFNSWRPTISLSCRLVLFRPLKGREPPNDHETEMYLRIVTMLLINVKGSLYYAVT